MFDLFRNETNRNSLPRKNSEFLAMYRKDIEKIIKPYGLVYEDRDEYYGSEDRTPQQIKEQAFIFVKAMPYGKAYIYISATGRLSEYNIDALFLPAIQEIANIEKRLFGEVSLKKFYNPARWHEGAEAMELSLLKGSRIMRDEEEYKHALIMIEEKLGQYMNFNSPKELFEFYISYCPKFFDVEFKYGDVFRTGYLLILFKLSGKDYYTELADKYVEINRDKIKKEYNVDITKLKEFLDTYTVGSLA